MTITRQGSSVFFRNESAKNILENIVPTDTKVYIADFKFEIIPKLPDTVKELFISSKREVFPLVAICGFSSNLESLLIGRTKNNKNPLLIPPFPNTLKKLALRNMNLSQNNLPPFPNSLQRFHVDNCSFTTLPISKSLTSLTLQNLTIETLPEGLENITDLEIINTPIREISSFPPKLQTLYLENVPIQTIPPLPTETLAAFSLHTVSLREPFDSIYQQYMEYLEENEEDQEGALKFLTNAINKLYTIPKAFEERQENLKQRAKNTYALRRVAKPNSYLPPGLTNKVASFLSGESSTKPIHQQLQTIQRKVPEHQPAGITQQPFVPAYQQERNNRKTRYRLIKALNQEKNMKKGGKQRKTRRNTKN